MGDAIRVVQVSDVSNVGRNLARAMGRRAIVTTVPMRQPGAHWPQLLKPAASLARIREALRVRSVVDALAFRPDVMHIHWLPNGLVGALSSRSSSRIPWVLHVHGDDVRDLAGWRLPGYRRLLQAADAVLFSTPDLEHDVKRWRPDAVHLPSPVRVDPLASSTTVWAAFAASAALPVKGAAKAFAALRIVASAQPGARLGAMDGPAFEDGPWERLRPVDHDEFLRRLGSSEVILGQLKLGAVGVVELEAMALGKPVVGWIGRNLYHDPPPIVSREEVDGLAGALVRLLNEPRRREELGAAGREWVRTYHDPRTIADRLISVYEQVLTDASRR